MESGIEFLKNVKKQKGPGLFIVDTRNILDEAVGAGCEIERFYYCPAGQEHIRVLQSGVKTEKVKKSYIDRFASVKENSGFLAVVKAKGTENIKEIQKADILVVLDRVQDPANTGAVIRSGAAFGFNNFLFCEGAYIFNEKSVRASAGAVFRVNYCYAGMPETLQALSGFHVISSVARDGRAPAQCAGKKNGKTALVLGSEGKGVRQEFIAVSDAKAHIEYPGKEVESLNVNAAAAILFHELSKVL